MNSLRWPGLACALAICCALGAAPRGQAAESSWPEDLVPKKVQALQYLATVSCFCPAHPGEIRDALLAALEDDSEVVRYEAALAIAHAARHVCPVCKRCSFCTVEMMDNLEQIGIGQNARGAWREPSERVRTAAYEALTACRHRLASVPKSVTDQGPPAPLPPGDPPPSTTMAAPSVADAADREPRLLAAAPPAVAQEPEKASPTAISSAGYAQATDLTISQQQAVVAQPPPLPPLTIPSICWEQDARQSAPILRARRFTAPVNE
jgi:hypothetical protein